MGVVGVGSCGKAVARRAKAFGMHLLGHDVIQMPADFLSESGIKMVPLAELLSAADFVSLNPDLNPSSYHLIGKDQLDLMKPNAYLINTSRGPVVNESALIRALQQDRIAGAALDVFEEEPLPAGSPLRQLDNCLLAPHNANSSPEAWQRVHENTVQNLLKGLQSAGEVNESS